MAACDQAQAGTSQPPLESENDVLSQALSSVGLAAEAPSETAAEPPPRKKKGMTHKVKSFLSSLPDLKHLYSKNVG